MSRYGVQYLGLAIVGAIVCGALGYCQGTTDGKAAARLEASTRAAAQAHEAREPVAASAARAVGRVRAAEPTVRASHDAARVLGPSTLEIRVTPTAQPIVVEVPAPVVARIVQDSLQLERARAAIDSLVDLRRADSVVMAADARVIADLRAIKTPRCGAKCGASLVVGSAVALAVIVRNADTIADVIAGRKEFRLGVALRF